MRKWREEGFYARIIAKKIDYSVVCINEFAKKKALSSKEAFLYLDQFAGIVF